MLCQKCTGLHFKPLEDHPSSLRDVFTVPTFQQFYLHSADPACLFSSADTGCHLCMMIQYHLFRPRPLLMKNPNTFSGQQIVFGLMNHDEGVHGVPEDPRVRVCYMDQFFEIDCISHYTDVIETMLASLAAAEIIENIPPGQDQNVFSPIVDTSTISPANISLASTWLRHCLQNHPGCASPSVSTSPPRRLINVRNPSRVFLEDGSHERKQYVALSYKWGSKNRFLSLTSNIDEHHRAMLLNALPKTFVDAIHVSQKLGFSYLWIDALCMVQDDPVEMSIDMDVMGDIFKGAALTLFAEAADHADVGLACVRDPRHVKPCRLDVRVTIDAKPVRFHTFASPHMDFFRPERNETPLRERGWVLQEEVAAVRALSFGQQQLRWDCHSTVSTEARPDAVRSFLPGQEKMLDKLSASIAEDHGFLRCLLKYQQRHGQFEHTGEPIFAWYDLVGDYSCRGLTYGSDVLRALAGLASIMAETLDLHYMNGIWEEDITYGLLWMVTARDKGLNSDMHPTGPALGPSWTWVSHWGLPISYSMHLKTLTKRLMVEVGWSRAGTCDYNGFETSGEEHLAAHADRKQSPCPAPLNLYQTMSTTKLALTGYVNTGRVNHSRTGAWRGTWARYILRSHDRYSLGVVYFDRDPECDRIDEVTMILCAVVPESDNLVREVSLALVPTACEDEYRRVGIADVRKEDFGSYDAEKLIPTFLWETRTRKTIVLV